MSSAPTQPVGPPRHRFVPFVASWFIFFSVAGAAPGAEPVNDSAASAKGIDVAMLRLHAPLRDTPPLSPVEEQAKFKVRDGLAVDLIAAEPKVRQPLYLTFDERGRMWVVQYLQYPIPAGLKVVEYDQYLRAKFDRVPEPPPKGVKGADVISILEDADADGTFEKQKTFVEGLNLCTAALPGNGGVWVMNPPYLLFYPDKDRDDVPDGNPVVHLSGFGLEDTHSIANSLTWGPDGWIYGAHGSTCTSKVRVEAPNLKSEISNRTTDFLGQCIWRYHPTRHVFEVFAEGGGNTFGVEFDEFGNCFSGTNWGNFRGMHYVQGGYSVKGWGKHGPLTNPYAFGFFEHMPHQGNADRLTHTFDVYGGGLLGVPYDGKIIGANSLMSWISVSRFEQMGSTFRTIEEEPLLTSDDGWFRPVDIKTGPDGALYIADFYEQRISHVDPRENWHRETGRIWRIRPKIWGAGFAPHDYTKSETGTLLSLLGLKESRTERATIRRVLSERATPEIIDTFRQRFRFGSDRAPEFLLAAFNAGGFDESWQLEALAHSSPVVRAWGVRLIGDDEGSTPTPRVATALAQLAASERELHVRSQLACTARRLSGATSMPVVAAMLRSQTDSFDPYIPLLLWWAVERAVTRGSQDDVLRVFANSDTWKSRVARETIYPRLARRYTADPTPENQEALRTILTAAPGDAERATLYDGIKEGFAGRPSKPLGAGLRAELAKAPDAEVAFYSGEPAAVARILEAVQSDQTREPTRVKLIGLLGTSQLPKTAEALIDVATRSTQANVRSAALAALANVDDPSLGLKLVQMLPRIGDANTSAAAVKTLCGRADWAGALLDAVQAKSVDKAIVPTEQLERLRGLDDAKLTAAVERIYGKPAKPTSEQARAEIERVAALVLAGPAGDSAVGKKLYDVRCARCHTLFGQGARIGPDLTPYSRQDVRDMAFHIVDPSGFVREEYAQFAVRTKAGQTYVGVVTAREAGAIELTDTSGQRTRIAKPDIKLERALPMSAMPTGLLSDLNDAQLRDFFAYLSQVELRSAKKN